MSDLYLVTGGAGFIGSSVVRTLLTRGQRVRVLDDLSTGKASNLAAIGGDIDFREASILDEAALGSALEGARYVVHLAAQVSVPASIDDPAHNHAVNATGTLRVFEGARAAGVERVAYAASCAIYGNDPTMPKVETMAIDPVSPYAVTKYLGEIYAACYRQSMGLDVVALRFFNVFGPRQDPSGGYAAVVPVFITRMLKGEAPTIFGDGGQTRDFVHVDNVVEGILAACHTAAAAGGVFNIGTGVQTSLLALVAGLNQALGTSLVPSYRPERAGDVRHSVADITRAREVLGYRAAVDLDTGLERTVAWYREETCPS